MKSILSIHALLLVGLTALASFAGCSLEQAMDESSSSLKRQQSPMVIAVPGEAESIQQALGSNGYLIASLVTKRLENAARFNESTPSL